jgi:hypothetical protein
MRKSDLKPGVFLHYKEIRKPIETHVSNGKKYISIRGNSLDNMLKVYKPLIITVLDTEGMMVLHPDSVMETSFEKSEGLYGKEKYHMYKYEWLPTDEFSLTLFNGAYGTIQNMRNLIKKQYEYQD